MRQIQNETPADLARTTGHHEVLLLLLLFNFRKFTIDSMLKRYVFK